MVKSALFLVSLLAATSAAAADLTVKTGESWMFVIQGGEPARARRVQPTAKPKPGEVLVTVRSMLGTTMSMTSNNPIAYIFRADLLGAGKSGPARSCTLPARGLPSFESWPQKATAVRLSQFKPAPRGGNCP